MAIGVTGKSGVGKTTISRILSNFFHFPHYDIDKWVYSIIEKKFRDEMEKLFGSDIFSPEGKLINRTIIGDRIFSDRDGKYKDLTTRIYKEVVGAIWGDSDLNYQNNNIIFDHILLPHMPEFWDECDLKILVVSNNSERYGRILKRDSITWEYMMLRDRASIAYNNSNFDIIITNPDSIINPRNLNFFHFDFSVNNKGGLF